MHYTWCRIDDRNQWETLTKQTDLHPQSYPVLVGLIPMEDGSTVVSPLEFKVAKELMKPAKAGRKLPRKRKNG